MPSDNPLVSCVMPTYNRREFIRAAIDCWLMQTYEPKELIIVDDGTDKVRDLIPSHAAIRYMESERITTGAKRNLCNSYAAGEVICHFDSDDWSVSDRIANQVKLLMESGKPAAGYPNIYYWNIVKKEAREYRSTVKGYVCGGTLCYLKSWWNQNPFPDKLRASDNDVIYRNLKNITVSPDLGAYVARAHDSNVGGDKRNIGSLISKDLIPLGFWENEALRLGK